MLLALVNAWSANLISSIDVGESLVIYRINDEAVFELSGLKSDNLSCNKTAGLASLS